MVPLLSGCSVGTPAERDAAQENDGAALQQAVSFVKLLQQVIANDLDITRLWPLIGYGAFVTGSVFVVKLFSMFPIHIYQQYVFQDEWHSEKKNLSCYWSSYLYVCIAC